MFFSAVLGCQHGAEPVQSPARPPQRTSNAQAVQPPKAPVVVPIDEDEQRFARTAEDIRIVPAVRRELDRVPGIAQHRLAIQSRRGVLTLAGEVNDAAMLRAAAQAAERVRGVRAIVNRLEVVPQSATDAEILANVENALKYDVVTQAHGLTATVEAGVVTLKGVVQTIPELEIAEEAALLVPGVRAVENQVEIDLVERVADDTLAARIRRRLSNDARMQDSRVRVDVVNSRVSLHGSVGSDYERRVARDDAWLAGVRSVDASGLAIRPVTEHLRPAATKLSDAQIEQAVEDALGFDARIPPGSIRVTSSGGAVRLEGNVPNEAAKLAAKEDALNTVGAREVDDRVRVEPPVAVADYLVEASVEQRLREHPGITIEGLDVSVEQGRVRLRGGASSNYEKLRAEGAASRVPGVLGVENELTLSAPPRLTRTDAQLRRDILTELRWDPRLDSSRVQVEVHDGVATIRGVVPDWETYNAVLENVFEASPVRVENRLERAFAAQDREFSFSGSE